MSVRRLLCLAASASLIVGGVLAVDIAPAAAKARTCATTATITSHSKAGHIIWYDSKKSHNGAVYKSRTLTRGGVRWYELHGDTITLSYGHNTFTLSHSAIFTLVCSGVTKAQGTIMPTISLLRGTVTITTTKSVLGAATTEEGLFGPVTSNPAMKYTLSRTMTSKKAPTPDQEFSWVADYTNQPTGHSTTSTLRTGKKVNVTPYVGPHIGTCRHVRSASLVTTHTAGHGTASYRF